MKQRLYIDVNAAFGRSSFREAEIPYTQEQLVADMHYYRIHAALLSPLSALSYSYISGNRELHELTKSAPRLFSIPVVAAYAPFESGEGVAYYERLFREGAKGFCVAPTAFNEPFTPFYYGEMMHFLASHNLPVVVRTSQAKIEDVAAMAAAFPNVRFLLLGTNWSENRKLYRAMVTLQNLYMDIGCNQANELVRLCKEQGFINRVLFGSDYPNRVPGALKTLVEYADITEEEKDMVAHGNACRLFSLELAQIERYPEAECELDEIALTMEEGRPLAITVLDAHTHMVSDGDATVTSNMMKYGECDEIIARMNKMGIDAICCAPWQGISTDGLAANDVIVRGMQKYPERILGYACCNPNYPEDLEGVFLYHHQYHFPGVKPYWPLHQRSLCDTRYVPWFTYANDHHLAMLVHSVSLAAIADIKILVKQYPDIAFILAHTGSSYDVARAHVEICKSCQNAWLEITYTTLYYGMIEYLVREVGAQRVLYGSDLPMRDPGPQMGWVAYARIPTADKVKIFGENFSDILKRVQF
ncbi:MAG: amidohydrolase family protein [Ruthenibacterium sp.]